MRIDLSIGFSVEVDELGRFELPNRTYTTADLKKIAREVNRECRKSLAAANLEEVDYGE